MPVTIHLTLCNFVATPVHTNLTESAVKPRNAIALESSSRYGIIATAIVLTWHRHALVNVYNRMDSVE